MSAPTTPSTQGEFPIFYICCIAFVLRQILRSCTIHLSSLFPNTRDRYYEKFLAANLGTYDLHHILKVFRRGMGRIVVQTYIIIRDIKWFNKYIFDYHRQVPRTVANESPRPYQTYTCNKLARRYLGQKIPLIHIYHLPYTLTIFWLHASHVTLISYPSDSVSTATRLPSWEPSTTLSTLPPHTLLRPQLRGSDSGQAAPLPRASVLL
jgi:hypothetical protein